MFLLHAGGCQTFVIKFRPQPETTSPPPPQPLSPPALLLTAIKLLQAHRRRPHFLTNTSVHAHTHTFTVCTVTWAYICNSTHSEAGVTGYVLRKKRKDRNDLTGATRRLRTEWEAGRGEEGQKVEKDIMSHESERERENVCGFVCDAHIYM